MCVVREEQRLTCLLSGELTLSRARHDGKGVSRKKTCCEEESPTRRICEEIGSCEVGIGLERAVLYCTVLYDAVPYTRAGRGQCGDRHRHRHCHRRLKCFGSGTRTVLVYLVHRVGLLQKTMAYSGASPGQLPASIAHGQFHYDPSTPPPPPPKPSSGPNSGRDTPLRGPPVPPPPPGQFNNGQTAAAGGENASYGQAPDTGEPQMDAPPPGWLPSMVHELRYHTYNRPGL